MNQRGDIEDSPLFLSFIGECNRLQISRSDRLLIGVSGGVDSIVMATLFKRGGYNFAVAHVNFNLRGNDSLEDRDFVEAWCKRNCVKFYLEECDANGYAKERKISVEMAARDIRYAFFARIVAREGFKYVAIAHNANDNVETFLLNLTRGTGLKGLCGIREINGNIVRPLLFAKRNQIEDFAQKNNIAYKTDRTNKENLYKRNLIRNKIVPLLEQLNPSVIDTIARGMENLKESYLFERNMVEKQLDVLLKPSATVAHKLPVCKKYLHSEIALERVSPEFYFPLKFYLSELSFSFQVIDDIFRTAGIGDTGIMKRKDSETTKIFKSLSGYVATIERGFLKIYYASLIRDMEDAANLIFQIESEGEYSISLNLDGDEFCRVTLWEQTIDKYRSGKDNEHSCDGTKTLVMDADKVYFPLKLRFLRNGDKFSPFGMKGKKSVADFLAGRKVDMMLKRLMPLIVSGESIIAIPDIEIAEDTRVSPATSRVISLKISF